MSDESRQHATGDELAVLARALGMERDDAWALLDACRWADQSAATRRYGYPKDNAIPAPMMERLADRRWVEDLLAIAEEDAPDAVLDLLRRHLAELGDG